MFRKGMVIYMLLCFGGLLHLPVINLSALFTTFYVFTVARATPVRLQMSCCQSPNMENHVVAFL